MELKDYQKYCINEVKVYLEHLADFRAKYEKVRAIEPELAGDFTRKAWEKAKGGSNFQGAIYFDRRNGLGEPLPNFCIKVPTGGGKTILATHALGLINMHYLKKQTGLVLWVVPTSQIYRQTLKALRTREHPYRQVLDLNSGGRTKIVEKTENFTPSDIDSSLVILLLMLPSANRQNKETLKIFQDSSGFDAFFPLEDQLPDHKNLLEQFPNLDYFGDKSSIFGAQVKTSLGNTLRILQPIVIIDEGHKAYSKSAQDTIANFNPSILVELSATPSPNSNILVSVGGQELNEEEMIKLDIHLTNKASYEWKDCLRDSIAKREDLHRQAVEHQGRTGVYIRPICLIQVERTGRDQRDDIKYIHAEDARNFLIKECSISPDSIAIKSSEKDDIEGIDLFDRDCPICYIITKQALQEGWDCSFAYILTILTNPNSKNAITQLVGRILRQPYARKTNVKSLDECYVFCFKQKAKSLIDSIRQGLQSEGLGDIAGNIVQEASDDAQIEVGYREQFKKFEGKLYLPRFVIQQKSRWRELSYEMDILSRINWGLIKLDELKRLPLSKVESKDETSTIGLSQYVDDVIEKKTSHIQKSSLSVDFVYITRQILDILPNPWAAYQVAEEVFSALSSISGNTEALIAENMIFIIEELRKQLAKECDRLAEDVFRELIETNQICFFLMVDEDPDIPTRVNVRQNRPKLVRENNDPIQRSLFDYAPEEDFNDMEKSIAIYLDEQERLLFWYRNVSRRDYSIQGWKKSRIYPDFIAPETTLDAPENCATVYVLESKGLHLKNEDTQYKRNIFEICNELGQKTQWSELEQNFFGSRIEFKVIFEDEWKRKIHEIFA
jgi:type III restriction enzyme